MTETPCMVSVNYTIDRRVYEVEIQRRVVAPAEAPRLAVVGFQPNPQAREILRLCIDSIRHFTGRPYELWVIDNASPPDLAAWLADQEGINVIFNRTPPREPAAFMGRFIAKAPSPSLASYCNAMALEIAARVIDPQTRYLMSLHMDTMACHPEWLDYLTAHFSDRCRGVGVRLDTLRVRTLHVLGMMCDFQLFRSLKMNYFPDLPAYDTGDGVSIAIEKAGYELWACRNTHTDPALVEALAPGSPYRPFQVDRVLNDANEVIFAHLGRGIGKTVSGAIAGKTTPEQWLSFGRNVILKNPVSGTASGA